MRKNADMPMSKITFALLEDIGYTIDYSKIETYHATPTPK